MKAHPGETPSQSQASDTPLDHAQEENRLLLDQLHLVQEELENKVISAKQANQAAEAAQIKHKAQIATLEGQLDSLKKANREQAVLGEENELLLEQLHLMQEAFEQKAMRAQELDKTAEAARQAVDEKNQALTKAGAEKSTLENQLKALQTRNQQSADQLAASQKENRLLQKRLLKLRETLENQERTVKAMNGNLSELKSQLAAAKKHQSDWEHKYHQAERDGTLALAAANRRIHEISTELNKVTKSRAWRLANPSGKRTKKTKKIAANNLEQQKAEIKNSGLFDEAWYLEKYPDVGEQELDPVEHYLKSGAYEGRNPSDTFDTAWYLSYYRDVTESGLNPLVHYIKYGRDENRAPRPGALVSLPAPSTPEKTK